MTDPATDSRPLIMYGTAWKKGATADLTRRAVAAGYRAVDTANQPLHYNEAGIGEGLSAAMAELNLAREDLFLQTKFTPLRAQGEELPYDRNAPLGEQVEESFRGSLAHLGTDYLDSYLLHAPHDPRRLNDNDRVVWQSLEALQHRGAVRHIGISNAAIHHLRDLVDWAEIKPAAVQNRCFARNGWDREVRRFCREHDIAYQGFSLLTANGFVLRDKRVLTLAGKYNATAAQIVFAFARQTGMIPLTGTTDERHMAEDLAACDIMLEDEEMTLIENIAS